MKTVKTSFRSLKILSFFLFLTIACKSQVDTQIPDITLITDKGRIYGEMSEMLDKLMNVWYPLSIDTVDGGMFSDINYKWELEGPQNKMIVTQARHLWTSSTVGESFPEKKIYKKIARHAFEFLKNKMWDKESGGFFDLVDKSGNVIRGRNDEIIKLVYGNAFAIYGLAAYYKFSGDKSALNLAIKTFHWIDKHSYDDEFGGYFQFLNRDGKPFKDGMPGGNSGITPPKDMNSSIHVMEAFTELYNVWPDSLLHDRLEKLFNLLCNKIINSKGYLTLYFYRDMSPYKVSGLEKGDSFRKFYFDHVSFGHDIETAYLLLETAAALKIDNPEINTITKRLVDHSVAFGIDTVNSGLFDAGFYFDGESRPEIIKNTKEWWNMAEALNSLLIMAEKYPDDKLDYYGEFTKMWQYVRKYLWDNEYGGFFWDGLDTSPEVKLRAKGAIWKGNYHTARALLNCLENLKEK